MIASAHLADQQMRRCCDRKPGIDENIFGEIKHVHKSTARFKFKSSAAFSGEFGFADCLSTGRRAQAGLRQPTAPQPEASQADCRQHQGFRLRRPGLDRSRRQCDRRPWPIARLPGLGITEVPTLCLDHLSPAQVRAFMIADNRLTEIAVWDDRLLAQQLQDLSVQGLDFDIEVTGFEMGEIVR